MNKKPKKKIQTSKIVLCVMIFLVIEIVIWTEYEMHRLNDISAIYSIVGVVATMCPVIWAYYEKSFKETAEEERLKFEREKFERSEG